MPEEMYLRGVCPFSTGRAGISDGSGQLEKERHPSSSMYHTTQVLYKFPSRVRAPTSSPQLQSSKLTWNWRGASDKTTILYIGPSMSFQVNLGEGTFKDRPNRGHMTLIAGSQALSSTTLSIRQPNYSSCFRILGFRILGCTLKTRS